MTKTSKALEKLSDRQSKRCMEFFIAIDAAIESGSMETLNILVDRFSGYLDALSDMGVIGNDEKKAIYFYRVYGERAVFCNI